MQRLNDSDPETAKCECFAAPEIELNSPTNESYEI